MKYKDWLQEWLDHYIEPTAKIRTYNRYYEIVVQHLIPKLGESEMDEITPIVLQHFVTELAIVLAVVISNAVKLKPLEDAAKNGTLTGEMVLNSFSNPQESKTVLRFFEKELEKCHKSNDLQGALKLIVVMADSGITFGLFKPDGNTVYNPAIGARDSFREWIYTETYTHGKSIPTEYAREQDRWSPSTYTYEVYGFKISFEKYKSGTLVCNVYTSSKGWYQIGYVHKDDSVYASVD